MSRKPAIFLDRDGTIIEDRGYLCDIDEVILFPGIGDALRQLQQKYLLFIITNQSGIAKGLTSKLQVEEVNQHLLELLESGDITITETFVCPHSNEDNCECKKPKPYFIYKAAEKYDLDLSQSYIIGDHPSDVECGINASITPIYVLTGHGEKHLSELQRQPLIFKNLVEASDYIIGLAINS